MLPSSATNKKIFQIGQWLIFSDYGELARRNMVTSWVCVAGLALVESIWLPMSALSFDSAQWPAMVNSLIYGELARRNMVTSWVCVAGLALVESIWLPMSALSFDSAQWPAMVNSLIYG